MTLEVTIHTGARLHFGLLAHRPASGRHFGGAGLMIDSPGTQLTLKVNDRDQIAAPPDLRARVEHILASYRSRVAPHKQPPPCRIEIHRQIPPHQGLGSGTQLALAVGKALAVCAGEPDLPLLELAHRVGRGTRSALGIHGFEQGGFLIDGGKRRLEDIGTLVSRVSFPAEWRIVLVTPPAGEGLSGTDEQTAFHRLSGMPECVTNRLCRLLLMEILPAIREAGFPEVSEGIYQYGQQVGAYFEPIQGGPFASPKMADLAENLRSRGIRGVGQSSWGPTLFVLEESQSAAEELVQQLHSQPPWADCEFHIAGPKNEAASVAVSTDSPAAS